MIQNKKIAVVTGGNRGIGKEIVRQFAQSGIETILTSRNKENGLTACKDPFVYEKIFAQL